MTPTDVADRIARRGNAHGPRAGVSTLLSAVAIGMTILCACPDRDGGAEGGNVTVLEGASAVPPLFYVPDDAQDVTYTPKCDSPALFDSVVMYRVKRSFPPSTLLQNIAQRCSEQGWVALENDLAIAGLPAGDKRGWTLRQGKRVPDYLLWSCWWIDSTGRALEVICAAEGKPDESSRNDVTIGLAEAASMRPALLAYRDAYGLPIDIAGEDGSSVPKQADQP